MKYYRNLRDVDKLSADQCALLEPVVQKYAFRANAYYLSLIDWDNPADPIRRQIIPSLDELDEGGRLDPSSEQTYTILTGLEHKYNSTVLLLVSNVCEGICRYCFRKRVFMKPGQELLRDVDGAMAYIGVHKEITNVLLTGGDPLVLTAGKLEAIISRLRQIAHVQIIRIGTRVPVFHPDRILEDPELADLISTYSLPAKKIYVMNHFCHPRELTDKALAACDCLRRAGAVLTNQCPLIRGVNDDPDVLAELMQKLSFAGIVPYYLFQCRPALGNYAYAVPIEEGYQIVEAAKSKVSGLAKRLRYVISHASGKLEIIAATRHRVFFKYHRAADDADSGRIIVCRSNPQARWLDDYEEILETSPMGFRFRGYGPE
ncbi:MAG TPA: KamA family radical SAM protein [Anaerohalosphaeraceae bacterium]|nr:KamA family radical SAM protein [Anaerohalosphaeraceae bacterium]HOL32691.1 KamA family radical SAM protein [Anaerohalosphaeraceae bacterium]HPC65376.1 KamA family radical SAM protein [Anaerohalosphaeraceae bacterium]